jgi:multidrug resistance protein, MATE family
MLASCWFLPRAGERRVRDLSVPSLRRAIARVPSLAWFGFVPAIAASLELAGFSWLIALSTQLGAVTAGAFQAMFSLHNLVFSLAIGFGSAAGVRVGNAVGAGEPGEAGPRTLIAAGLTLVVIGAISAAFALFAHILIAPFSDDRAVLALAGPMLMLMAPFMLFDGIQYVLSYALRSLGEQIWAGINSIIGFFLVTGVLGWWLARTGWGAQGLVWAAGLGMITTAALQLLRFRIAIRRLKRTSD